MGATGEQRKPIEFPLFPLSLKLTNRPSSPARQMKNNPCVASGAFRIEVENTPAIPNTTAADYPVSFTW
jgi:hypothetical protein